MISLNTSIVTTGLPDNRVGLGYSPTGLSWVQNNLTLGDQIAHHARHIFNRHGGIDAALIEQLDVIGLQPLQRRLGHPADLRGLAVDAATAGSGHRVDVKAKFGGNPHMMAERGQRRADNLLVRPKAVSLGNVKEHDAKIIGIADQGDAGNAFRCRIINTSQAHTAKADL